MSNYRRARVPGACYFFTVNLRDRSSDLLIREIDLLRETVRATRLRHPFHIDAWVVLPEHMHCMWTLPPDDADFALRWKVIKFAFAKRAVGDALQLAGVVFEGADVAPIDLVGAGVEMVVAQHLDALQHRVDLRLLGDESVEGGSGVSGLGHGGLQRLMVTPYRL